MRSEIFEMGSEFEVSQHRGPLVLVRELIDLARKLIDFSSIATAIAESLATGAGNLVPA